MAMSFAPIFTASSSLYPRIASIAPFFLTASEDPLIKLRVSSLCAASSGSSPTCWRSTLLDMFFTIPLTESRAPVLAARYAAPPTPPAGNVAPAKSVVAVMSTRTGAIISPDCCQKPCLSPNISWNSTRFALSLALSRSISRPQSAPAVMATKPTTSVRPSSTDAPRPLATVENAL